MWYKIENNKIIQSAPKNKKLEDGRTIINYNSSNNKEMLETDGYVEYIGNKSIYQLKVVDGQIIQKSEQELSEESKKNIDNIWNGYYQKNPDLIVCVTQYKQLLDTLGLGYQAKTYDISTAITNNTALNDIQKINLGFTATTLWNNIVLNIESLDIKNPMSFAWENMTKLIEYLPQQQSTIIENTEAETTELTEQNIVEQTNQ